MFLVTLRMLVIHLGIHYQAIYNLIILYIKLDKFKIMVQSGDKNIKHAFNKCSLHWNPLYGWLMFYIELYLNISWQLYCGLSANDQTSLLTYYIYSTAFHEWRHKLQSKQSISVHTYALQHFQFCFASPSMFIFGTHLHIWFDSVLNCSSKTITIIY